GDGDRDRLLRLHQLLLHLDQHLGQHLLGILGLRDEVVEVRLDQRPESGKDAHGFPRGYGINRGVATLAPSVILRRDARARRRCPSHETSRATSASSWTATVAGPRPTAGRGSTVTAPAPTRCATSPAPRARSASRR